MYPLVLRAGARHRREPSARQRIRAASAALITLALVAGFGVFGGTVLGGVSGQARVLETISGGPVGLHVAGWLLCAVPLAGLFGLLVPTRSRVVRAGSLALLIPGVLAMVAMSKPRGIDSADWRLLLAVDGVNATEFLRAVEVTSYTVMAGLLLWAMAAAIAVASARRVAFDDLVAGVRRSSFAVGPLLLAASYAATVFFR